MSCITSPEDTVQVANDLDKNPAFLLDQIMPDQSYTTFGRDDLTQGCEMWLKGRIFLKHSMPWQLRIITTAEERSNEKWIGFFISIEDICTLGDWKNWAYFDLTVRTALQKKHAKNVQYSPTNSCWGWSKCFKLGAVTSCKANPLLIEIGFEHHRVLPCLLLPCVFAEETTNEVENFKEAWGKVMAPEGEGASGKKNDESSGTFSKSTDDSEAKGGPRPMILDQETRRLHSDYFHMVSPRPVNPTCLSQPSRNTNSYEYLHSYVMNSRRKVRSAF